MGTGVPGAGRSGDRGRRSAGRIAGNSGSGVSHRRSRKNASCDGVGSSAALSSSSELRGAAVSEGDMVHGASGRSGPFTKDREGGRGGPDVVGGGAGNGVGVRRGGTFSFSAAGSG